MEQSNLELIYYAYKAKATRPDGSNSSIGEYLNFQLDNDIDLVTSKDAIILDGNNKLIHCICLNTDPKSQPDFPVKIISAEFDSVQRIEAVLSRENFAKFLDDGFLATLITSEQKELLIKITDSWKSFARQDNRTHPYFKPNNDVVTNKQSNIHMRDDLSADENTEVDE